MDIIALVRAGRHAEVIAALEPLSRRGDSSASNNLAVVHRMMGDGRNEVTYALAAFHQDPSSIVALSTLFRALFAAGHFRLLTDVYSAFPSKGRLDRDHHLNAAMAFCRINRTESAKDALGRLDDYPLNDAGDIEVGLTLATALSDHPTALRHLEALSALGHDIHARHMTELFAAGDMRAALDLFEAHRRSNPGVAAKQKTALLCAISLGDRARVEALNIGQAESIQRLASNFLADATHAEVKGRSRTYRFPFGASNLSISLQHAMGRFYEQGVLGLLHNLLSPGALVLDVGANVGNHTVYFAGEAGCHVIPFECNPNLVPRLRAAVETAGLDHLVDLQYLGSAISDAVGTSHFNFIRDDYSNVSSHETSSTRPVPCLSLDSLPLPSCRLLKIDVDGGELPVLKGAAQLLTRHRPIVAIEVMNQNITPVLDLFSSHGYDIFREDARPEVYSDFIFAPQEMKL